jgi:hypothetical protein
MVAGKNPRARFLAAVTILVSTAFAGLAQTAPDAKTPAPKGTDAQETPKPAPADSKTAKKPAAPAGWASEAEARSHCRGTIIWVDKDHFNHYAGSREYGRKPGNFACES